jgi:hypothetical protein
VSTLSTSSLEFWVSICLSQSLYPNSSSQKGSCRTQPSVVEKFGAVTRRRGEVACGSGTPGRSEPISESNAVIRRISKTHRDHYQHTSSLAKASRTPPGGIPQPVVRKFHLANSHSLRQPSPSPSFARFRHIGISNHRPSSFLSHLIPSHQEATFTSYPNPMSRQAHARIGSPHDTHS